jgi:hypothetical protein
MISYGTCEDMKLLVDSEGQEAGEQARHEGAQTHSENALLVSYWGLQVGKRRPAYRGVVSESYGNCGKAVYGTLARGVSGT